MADFSHIVVARHPDCGHIIATLIVVELFYSNSPNVWHKWIRTHLHPLIGVEIGVGEGAFLMHFQPKMEVLLQFKLVKVEFNNLEV